MKNLLFISIFLAINLISICYSQDTLDLFDFFDKYGAPGNYYTAINGSSFTSLKEEEINSRVKQADWNNEKYIEVKNIRESFTMNFNYEFSRQHIGGTRTNLFILERINWYQKYNDTNFIIKLGDILITGINQNYLQIIEALEKNENILVTEKPYSIDMMSNLRFIDKDSTLAGTIEFFIPNKGSRKKRMNQSYVNHIKIYNPRAHQELHQYIKIAPDKFKNDADKPELMVHFPPISIHGSLSLDPAHLNYKKIGDDLHYTHFVVKDFKDWKSENTILLKKDGKVLDKYYGISSRRERHIFPLRIFDSKTNQFLFFIKQIHVSPSFSYLGAEVGSMPLDNGLLFTGKISANGEYDGNYCKEIENKKLYQCYINQYPSLDKIPDSMPDYAALSSTSGKLNWVYDDGTDINSWHILSPTHIKPFKKYEGEQIYIVYQISIGTNQITDVRYLIPTKSKEFPFILFEKNGNYKSLSLYPKTVIDQHTLGKNNGIVKVNRVSYDPINNIAKINNKEWFEGIKELTFKTNKEYKEDQEKRNQEIIAEQKMRQELKWAEEQKERERYNKSRIYKPCPVCAGNGKEYQAYNKTVKNSKVVDETDYHYTIETKTENQVWYNVKKCSLCGGSGQIK